MCCVWERCVWCFTGDQLISLPFHVFSSLPLREGLASSAPFQVIEWSLHSLHSTTTTAVSYHEYSWPNDAYMCTANLMRIIIHSSSPFSLILLSPLRGGIYRGRFCVHLIYQMSHNWTLKGFPSLSNSFLPILFNWFSAFTINQVIDQWSTISYPPGISSLSPLFPILHSSLTTNPALMCFCSHFTWEGRSYLSSLRPLPCPSPSLPSLYQTLLLISGVPAPFSHSFTFQSVWLTTPSTVTSCH